MTPRHIGPTLVLLIAVMVALSVPSTASALPKDCSECTITSSCRELCAIGFKVYTCGEAGICDPGNLVSVAAADGVDASTALFTDAGTAPLAEANTALLAEDCTTPAQAPAETLAAP